MKPDRSHDREPDGTVDRPVERPLVLAVNDHVANLYLIVRMLRSAGFDVIEARTGHEALDRARTANRPPDVAVLDVRLPDISGFEVCRRLKADERTRDIKVLHTSATFVSSNHKVAGLESGADGYLTQPFEPQDLIATVRSLLRLRSAEASLQAHNASLLDADRRKDEFLAMLAHELRNPLASVQTALPLLSRFPPRDELEARTLEILGRQTTQLIRLVDDLLDVSRVTRGRIELQLAPLDLTALATAVCDAMRTRVTDPRQQTLALAVPGQPVWIRGDAARLEQVLTNLIDNASKYSDPETSIEVAVERAGERAVLTVSDRGIGIDAETLPAIFGLFAQATTSLARSRGGLGIGLTLVQRLVELHAGAITASSPGVGHGTVMRVELPLLVSAAIAAPPPAAPAPITDGGCSILLIDDNEDGREMLRALCEISGHAVTDAPDGTQGVAAALAGKPELALIDIGLPDIDGYEVARQVRTTLGGAVYLAALSGYGSPEHRKRAFEAGFDEHIAKPITLAQLERVVAAATARRR